MSARRAWVRDSSNPSYIPSDVDVPSDADLEHLAPSQHHGVLPDGVELPDWAERAHPVRRLRKCPLFLHYTLAVALFCSGMVLFGTSATRVDGDFSGGVTYVLPSRFLSSGVYVFAAVLGVALVLFSWLSCAAAERGLCGKAAKAVFLLFELAFVLGLTATGIAAFYLRANPNSNILDTEFRSQWEMAVASNDSSVCTFQEQLSCSGFHTGDCGDGQGGGNPKPELCPNCGTSSKGGIGCSPRLLELYQDYYGPLGWICFILAIILIVDLTSVICLLPCFEIEDGSHVILRTKKDIANRRLARSMGLDEWEAEIQNYQASTR